MENLSVRLAFILLLLTALWISFEHFMGYNTTRNDIGQYTRMVPMLVYWVFVFVLIWMVRKQNQNTLTLREGLTEGITYSLIYSAGFTFIILIYSKFINPNMHEIMQEFTMQQMVLKNATQGETDEAMRDVDMIYSGTRMSYILLFTISSLYGIGISFLASLLFRKKKAG